jgi:hypothetical protein
VLEACRFEYGVPIEVRPTGAWGGWCGPRDGAPDGRIVLTKKICFWSTENIISVYLHESTHRFLEGREVAAHGPEFFCFHAILLLRGAAFFRLDPLFKLDLYDMNDQPAEVEEENWRGIVLNWAIPVAAELAATDASAEALAAQVCERWNSFIQEREKSRVAAAQQVAAARKYSVAQKEKIESLQSSLFVARTFLFVGWASLFSVVYFVF